MKAFIIFLLIFFIKVNPQYILDGIEEILKNKTISWEEMKKNLKAKANSSEAECLASETETIKIYKEKFRTEIKKEKITKNMRFIAGSCSPVILIPGILSTQLRAEIDCENLYNKEKDIYKKMKLFCRFDNVCPANSADNFTYYDERLFLNLLGTFGINKHYWQCNNYNDYYYNNSNCQNLYSACFSFLMGVYNKYEDCANLETNKHICTKSDYIKITFFGGTKKSYNESECGINAIRNIFDKSMGDAPQTKVFGDIVNYLLDLGYSFGFSLGGVPNDFRKFISTNYISTNILRYLIDSFYNNTGKKVIIIGHSFGNLVALNNLVSKENQYLIPKIKKFIAVAPPFAGSTKLITSYLHDFTTLDTIITKFEYFGQALLFKSFPLLSELLPFSILSKLSELEEYKDFVKMIKDRIKLENCLLQDNCTEETALNMNQEFDEFFKSYYPSLKEPACNITEKYNLTGLYEKRCFLNYYNIFDNPLFISVNNSTLIDSDNFDMNDYCNNNKGKCFYPIEKNEDKRSIEELMAMGRFAYGMPEMQELFEIYNKNKKEYFLDGDNLNNSDFESEDEFRKENLDQIEYNKIISLIKDLPIPPVDTEIVYSSLLSTETGEFINDNDAIRSGKKIYSGGDGNVSSWSSSLVGLKWIYDKKKKNLPQNIKLVEYCSKLYNYSYYNNSNNNFVSLRCKCFDQRYNKYSFADSCSHQYMLQDSYLHYYLKTIISNDNTVKIKRIEAAKKSLNDNTDYEMKCNLDLLNMNDTKITIPENQETDSNENEIINNIEIKGIILGFNNYLEDISKTFFTFDLNFIIYNDYIISENMTISMNIKYKSLLRNLESKEAVCKILYIEGRKYKGQCKVEVDDTSKIDNIGINLYYEFSQDKNVKLVLSPLAYIYSDNIQNIEKEDYSSYNVYILQNSNYINYNNEYLNIKGIIEDPQPNFTNINLILNNNNNNESKTLDFKL